MGTLIDRIERALFGATAQERVNLMARIGMRGVESRLLAALAEMETDGPEYFAIYDRAFGEAKARGLDYETAHREAARIADEWKAEWKAAQQREEPTA